jgi:hypothetical protein
MVQNAVKLEVFQSATPMSIVNSGTNWEHYKGPE